jgi:hypothetical protein
MVDSVLCAAGPGVSLQTQFERKVPNKDDSDVYLINEEFIASLDYLVACFPWAGIPDFRMQAIYFKQRVAYYKHFNGRDWKKNWCTELLECLESWQMFFPSVAQKRRSGLEPPQRPGQAADAAMEETIPADWL